MSTVVDISALRVKKGVHAVFINAEPRPGWSYMFIVMWENICMHHSTHNTLAQCWLNAGHLQKRLIRFQSALRWGPLFAGKETKHSENCDSMSFMLYILEVNWQLGTLSLSSLNLPLSSSTTTSRELLWLVVDKDDLMWMINWRKLLCICRSISSKFVF